MLPCRAAPCCAGAARQGLKELVTSYENGDARLPEKVKLHVANRAGEPLAMVRLRAGSDSKAARAKLKAAGLRRGTRSVFNPSLMEGYLSLSNAQRGRR